MACALIAPTGSVYLTSLAFQLFFVVPCVIVSAIISHGLRQSGRGQLCWLLSIGLFVLPFCAIEATARVTWLPDLTADAMQAVRFTFGSLLFISGYRMVELATGNAPGKAASSRESWIEYLTSSDARRDEDGKPLKAEPGALQARASSAACHFAGVSVTNSLLISSAGMTPLSDALGSAAWGLDDLLAVFVIWLTLAFMYDIDTLLLELKGFQPVPPFRNPLLAASSISDLWSRRWNMQVQAMLKRACYLPTLQAGLPRAAAAAAAFCGSALFHELQFLVAFRARYALGRASLFFAVQAGLVIGFKAAGPFVPKAVAAWPAPLKTFVTLACLLPTAHLFTDIWKEAGMFESIGALVFTYRCA